MGVPRSYSFVNYDMHLACKGLAYYLGPNSNVICMTLCFIFDSDIDHY